MGKRFYTTQDQLRLYVTDRKFNTCIKEYNFEVVVLTCQCCNQETGKHIQLSKEDKDELTLLLNILNGEK